MKENLLTLEVRMQTFLETQQEVHLMHNEDLQVKLKRLADDIAKNAGELIR